VIPLQRVAAPERTQRLLADRRQNVASFGGTVEVARSQWRLATTAKEAVRELLGSMAHGATRCMYCEDSFGTDIDHFQPIAVAPGRAFDWLNHLLACSCCNSNEKRDAYPCDADGRCLLVDPTAEDPAEHLLLMLATGVYEPLTEKGRATITTFGLNRAALVEGRQAAFVTACAVLRDWHRNRKPGTADALRRSPFANVVRSMTTLLPPVADRVLDDETRAAVAAWVAADGTAG
jgi:uncharacterized protein (TIGR02646 family)